MDSELLPYRLRTARQKKRLRKGDFDKQLLRLERRENALSSAIETLPLIELEEPYQRGWLRTFAVRDDVRHSEKGSFFAMALLKKINMVDYSPTRQFLSRRVRKYSRSRKKAEERGQSFVAIDEWDWYRNRRKLTEAEKQYFSRIESWDSKHRIYTYRYVFTEPWRYVLTVRPRMVTHRKQLDALLEQEISAIQNRIDNQFLRPRMNRLKGAPYRWRRNWEEDPTYRSPLKNKPLHALLGALSEDQTTLPKWAP